MGSVFSGRYDRMEWMDVKGRLIEGGLSAPGQLLGSLFLVRLSIKSNGSGLKHKDS